MAYTPQDAASADAVLRARDDCCRLLVLVHLVISNPTEAGVDAIVAAAATTNTLVPKPSYSLDGESYQWESYRRSLEDSVERLQKLAVILQGPFEVRSRGV